MKILSQGKKPGDKTHIATCNYCQTQIEFQVSEGMITRDNRDGDRVSIACPTCANMIHSLLCRGT